MRGLVAALAGLMLLAPAASASEVYVEANEDNSEECRDVPAFCEDDSVVHFEAATGEANQVEFSEAEMTFRDPKSTIKAGAGCTAKNQHEVSCKRPADLTAVQVSLLDGDDRLTLDTTTLPSDVRGEAGDDEITGGAARDEVLDGAGRDRVVLGAGDDVLYATDQSETLAADVFDGGEGRDTIDYGTRSAGVTIDLADPTAPGGEDGEGDSLSSFEDAFGTGRDDAIVGSAVANVIHALSGNDRIEGGDGGDTIRGYGGNDRIYGGNGRDVLIGEGGADKLHGGCNGDRLDGGQDNDRINARDGARDRVEGSNGRDVATVDAGRDRVSRSTERVKALPPATIC